MISAGLKHHSQKEAIMANDIDDHEYACLTTPLGKRRKKSITSMLEDLDLDLDFSQVSYNENDSHVQDAPPFEPNEMQLKAIQAAGRGDNLFLTGKAGTGKSKTTEQIVAQFAEANKVIHVTAPTGIAAINVDGITINSWGKFGLGSSCEYTLHILLGY